MYFKVASNFYYVFLKLSTKLSFENIYFPVVLNFYQAAWKIHQSFGGNFKPWSFEGFIKQQL